MASKTLQSTIEISGVLSPSLQSAIKNAVSKLDEMSKETLESAGAAEKLSAEIGAQESVLKSLQKGYADYIVSGKKSSDEAQTLANKIQELSGELDENKGTLQAAEKAAKKLAESQDDSADAYTRLERKVSSQQDELEALRREYANVVLEQGKASKEAKQLESKIGSLSKEVDKGEKQLRDLGEAAEEAGRKAEGSSGGYTVLKNVIANLATEAISMAVEGFKELATEGDTALGMLEAKTGATGQKMKGFEDVMYEVYNANYGENLGDVSEKLSTVIQMTDDLDNASLAKVTKNAIALEDVFGFDVTESMRAVNSLMDQFGITSDQAFNLLVQGAQNGLNQNDDLLDTINEYSVQFKNAGYTADDMFNMLANGTATGTWSVDKLGDAVKEFNIRMSDGTANDYLEQLGVDVDTVMAQFNKGGPEAQKAIGTVMDAILDCDDATLQYQTGVGLFGTMWEDLGAETVASLMETEGAISSTSDAMSKMDSAAYDTLESSFSQLGRTIKAEVVQPISVKLIPVVKEAVEFTTTKVAPAVDWFLKNLPTIGVLIAGISAAVVAFKWGSIVSGIMKAVGAVKAFGAALMANPIGLIIAGVTALVTAFVYLWNNCEGFRNFWINLWENIKDAASAAWEWIKNAWNAIASFFSETWESIKATASAVWNGIASFFSNIWNGIKNTAVSVWNGITSFFTNTMNGIKTTFSNIWNGITSFLSGAWETIKNVVQVGVQLIGSILSAAFQIITLPFRFIWENCKEYVFAAWEWIKKKVTKAINAVKSTISSVWNAIKTVTSTVWNAIKGVISTVWNGIKSAVTAAVNAVKSTVSNAWNGIKSVTSSVWNGIKSTVSNVWGGIKSGVSSAVNSVKSTVSGVWNGIKSTTSSVWNGIKNAILTPIEAAKSKVKGMVDSIKGFFGGLKISLPKIKLPHFKISGGFSIVPPKVPKLSIDWYKDGGIMTRPTVFGASGNTLMAGGEAGAEAVLPLTMLWEKMESMLRRILSNESDTGETSGEGLTSKAGELLTLDNFSLGSLADGTNVVIYYDFSNFTWSPQIHAGGTGDGEDDLMARLRAHEAEFFDWLEEFIQMREVAQYA